MHETAHSFANLESPAPDTSLPAGRTILRGWVVPKPGFHFTDLRARLGAREFPGVHGFPRADLAAYFKTGRPWIPAEFTVGVDFAPGTVDVQFEALDLSGRWMAVYATRFTVGSDSAPASTPPDRLTAGEFGRAARLAFLQGAPVVPPWPRVTRVGHKPFHGYLAQPHAIAPALFGRLQVLGWLFHENIPIKRAFVTTDLLTFQNLEFGGEFAGVSERYHNLPVAADCRFQGMVDVSSRLPAPASVRVFAELPDGSVHLCLAVLVRPILTEELKQTWPAFAPLNFWQHWSALRRQWTAAGVPLETGAPLRREFWASLRTYRRLAPPAMRPPSESRPNPKGEGGRLLLVTHNLNLEGAPLLFAEYATHLSRQAGARITVLSGQEGPLRAVFAAAGATVQVVDPGLVGAPSRAELDRQLDRLARQLDWNGIDLVVANTVSSFWGVLLANRVRRPSLLYIHESTPPAVFFQRGSPALLPAAYAALAAATAVSFNTPATQAYYAAPGGGKNFHLNPAWINVAAIDAFRAAHARAALRAKLGIGPDELLVVNIGTVCERKGQHDFLREIEWLARIDPALVARCRFVMVGGRDTRYNEELNRDLAALGRANVAVVPETTRAFDWFGAADVFACTSYEESFPRVVLEAMAFEVPIVSTHVHGIPYMLRDGDEARLVAPGDIAAFTAALHGVLTDLPAARTRAYRARARVAEFDAAILLPHHARFTASVGAPRA